MNGTEEELQLSLDEGGADDAAVAGGDDVAPVVAQPEPAPPAWTGELVDTLRALRDQKQPQAPVMPERPAMSQTQIDELNTRLAGEILTNPLGVIGQIAHQAAQEQIGQFRREAEPYINEATTSSQQGFLDRFKRDKREDDPLYKQTIKEFERDLESDPIQWAGRTAVQRNREAELRWDAAQGRQLKKKVVMRTQESRPPGSSAGGGTSMGSGGGSNKVYEMPDSEKRQLYIHMSREEADAFIAKVESGEAGIA